MSATFADEATMSGSTFFEMSMVELSGGQLFLVDEHNVFMRMSESNWWTRATYADLPWVSLRSPTAFLATGDITVPDLGVIASEGDIVVFSPFADVGEVGTGAYIFCLSNTRAVDTGSTLVSSDWSFYKISTSMPMRSNHSIVRFSDGRLFLWGGIADNGTTFLTDVWTSTDWKTWTEVTESSNFAATFPNGLAGSLPAILYDEVYFYGGEDDSSLFNLFWKATHVGLALTFAVQTTPTGYTTPNTRHRHVFLADERLVMIGGFEGGVHVFNSDLTEITTITDSVPAYFLSSGYNQYPASLLLDSGDVVTTIGSTSQLQIHRITFGSAGSGSGDPYVLPLNTGVRIKLPMAKAFYRLYSDSDVVVNASVTTMTHTKAYASVDVKAARKLVEEMIRRGQSMSSLDELSFFDRFAFMDVSSGSMLVVSADTCEIERVEGDAFTLSPRSRRTESHDTAGGMTVVEEVGIMHTRTGVRMVHTMFPKAPLLRNAIALDPRSIRMRRGVGLLVDPRTFPAANPFGQVSRLTSTRVVQKHAVIVDERTSGDDSDMYMILK